MIETSENKVSLSITDSPSIGENAFNAIRFLCCLIVIIGHCLDLSRTPFAYRSIIDMHTAVCVFFILSGFWVTKSFLFSRSLKQYAFKRIKRLLPMYYLTVVLFALICAFYSDLGIKAYFCSVHVWKYLFWNGIFLNFMCPSLPGVFDGAAINGALWTIKVEIGFYVVLPALILLLKKIGVRKKQNLMLAGIYILSVLWNALLAWYAPRLHIPSQLSYQLPGFMSYFVMGVFFLFNGETLIAKKNFFILPAVLVFFLHYRTRTEFLMPCSLACIVMWAGSSLTFLKRIGQPLDYSYGMYLFHFPLIQILTSHKVFNNTFVWGGVSVIAISFFMAFIAEKYLQSKYR